MPQTVESLKSFHAARAAEAKRLYQEARDPVESAKDWRAELRAARQVLARALRASDYFADVASALRENGGHMLALRHVMAPPISQDQFKLLCPDWSKGSENNDKPVAPGVAVAVAATFGAWRDRHLTRWLDTGRRPTRVEMREILLTLAPLIANQTVATSRRNRLAARQEQAVVALLERKGWARLPSSLIDRRAAVPERHFMHKTRFATATAAPQEVDVACGLRNTVVLAMECKVTNDETNSVKRVNDVLKKAEAWKTHWGSFVITAALLDGVIAAKDVERLIDAKVRVFWSHDLDSFSAWLDDQF
ncbi:XamI family restriction endonuclease [Magnetospirillum fulvum]|uniref:XamI restriction endonuclease n=1 Tax=Magnetospirillum fulvum TaxID=1082 RepID=A0A1H6HJK4_MAGFU|nr:XamI family restriction endonuclease [Magnetospirillum fulvum]SEH35989.1 XamI restriction endonuclease [Magnetospirillum fulvum]